MIFISIDDNEQAQLKLLCDEVFGAENFVVGLIWKSRQIIDSRNKTNASNDHEYILIYAKNIGLFRLLGKAIDTSKYSNPDDDPRGVWMSNSILGLADATQRPNLHYDLVEPETGRKFSCPVDTGWRYSHETMDAKIKDNRIIFQNQIQGDPERKNF